MQSFSSLHASWDYLQFEISSHTMNAIHSSIPKYSFIPFHYEDEDDDEGTL